MIHLNCFVLEAFAKALHQSIAGKQILDCFSNRSGSCVFEFENAALEIVFQDHCPYYLFSEHIPSKSRLFKPQFKPIIGQSVLAVKQHPFERRFEIQFSDDLTLLFKGYGKQSNLIVFRGNQAILSFNKQAQKDLSLRLTDFAPTVLQPWPKNSQSLSEKQWSFLPKNIIDHIKSNNAIQDLPGLIDQWQNIKGFDITNGLIPLFFGENTVLNDLNHYCKQQLSSLGFEHLKSALIEQTQKNISEKTNYLAQHISALEQLTLQRNDEEIGHIILANMNQFSADQKQVELIDIYNNQSIFIDWHPELSVIENADVYFQKAKAKPHRLAMLKQKISDTEFQLQILHERLTNINKAQNSKALKALEKPLQLAQQTAEKPYRLFELEGYQILVGKHAESNDQLLNQFSDKDDLWLHAKDVSGSHVIIKTNKKPTPKPVIETAAAIAAYYSKNRQQQLVTVMCTARKYVRKLKGSKGLVHVSQETTYLVHPKLPQTLFS